MNCERNCFKCKRYARDKKDESSLGYIYYYNIHVVVSCLYALLLAIMIIMVYRH